MKKLIIFVYQLNEWFGVLLNSLKWRLFFKKIGSKSTIYGRIKVYSPQNISLGTNSRINDSVILNALSEISIGDDVHISPGVIINTGSLDYQQSGIKRRHLSEPVIIEDGVWIASGAIINPGVTIGKGAIVAAGAVVTRDVKSHSLVAGIPARKLKNLHGNVFKKQDRKIYNKNNVQQKSR